MKGRQSMSATETKERIISISDDLFYEKGFEATSFADIAREVSISRGNFYYHFKTKDQILQAVIEKRLKDRQMLLDQWEQDNDPAEAIRKFINILIMNRAKIMMYGCPIGTLTSELSKLNHSAVEDANRLFTLFRVWLKAQFETLGLRKNSDELALHLLALSQGVATLANAFKDAAYVEREVESLYSWLNTVIGEKGQKA